MKPITEYQNFRTYMLDYFHENKRRGRITWRGFSKHAGFSSSGYLMLVCNGKANLSDSGMVQVAKAMGLNESETAYFCELVRLDQSKCAPEKNKSLENLQKLAKDCPARVLTDDALDYFANWHNVVMREIAPHAVPNTKTFNIGRLFLPEISASEVSRALKFLTATGLLEKKEDGSYVQTDKVLTSGNKDVSSVALRNFHKQMNNLAIEALDNIPIAERNASEMVIGVTKEQYAQIVQKIAKFQQEILEMVTATDDVHRVYCLQTNLFPLSHKFNSKDTEDA